MSRSLLIALAAAMLWGVAAPGHVLAAGPNGTGAMLDLSDPGAHRTFAAVPVRRTTAINIPRIARPMPAPPPPKSK